MSLWLSRTIVTTARGPRPRGGCFVLSSIQNQPVPLVTERPTFTSLSPCYFSTSSLLSPSYWDDDCNKPSTSLRIPQKEQMVVGRELSSPAGARHIIVHAISTTTAATTAAPNDGGCVVSVRPSSSTTTIDIPAVDEEQGRNLPVSQEEEVSCMISVLSAASKEEEQKEEHDDHLLLHQQQGTMEKQTTTNNGTCISSTMKSDYCKEDDTLSTASSSSTECTSNNSSSRFFEAPPRRLTKKTEEEQLQSMEHNVKRLNNNDVSTSTINSQIRAMLIMKDVIFRQRSAIKHISKENATIQRKYEFYKLQNKSLSRASKQMKREVNKVCKKNEALEHELESLRTELQELAKVETL